MTKRLALIRVRSPIRAPGEITLAGHALSVRRRRLRPERIGCAGIQVLIGLLSPLPCEPVSAQGTSAWVLGAAAGFYRFHDRETGLALAAEIARGRHLIGFLNVTKSIGNTDFTAFDLGVEVHPLPSLVVSPFVGVGAGPLLEWGSSLAASYFVRVGVEIRVMARDRARLLVRRGRHQNLGDPVPSYPGPHLFMVGWVHRL